MVIKPDKNTRNIYSRKQVIAMIVITRINYLISQNSFVTLRI